MNNPKLNMLIRFTLDIILVFLLLSSMAARSSSTKSAEAPKEERRNDRPGAGVEVARLTLNAGSEGARVRLRGRDLPLAEPATLQAVTANKPDHMIVEISGSPEWQRLLNYALENDVPISIEIKD